MQLNLLVIRTNQPKELAEFYNIFQLEFEYHRHGKGAWHYSTKIENIVFEIYPLLKSQKIADRSLRLGFEVKELDNLIEQLRKKNIEIVSKPKQTEWGYVAIIKDLDGRKIELTEIKT
ncbi:MAG: VOC family protein [Saprospiraceae bacterium]